MEMEVDDGPVLYPMQTEKPYTPTPDYSDYKDFTSTGTAIVIDNGNSAISNHFLVSTIDESIPCITHVDECADMYDICS